MMSKSFSNLQDLAMGIFPGTSTGRELSQEKSVPGNVKEPSQNGFSDSVSSDRIIIVANQLPLTGQRRDNDTGWVFSFNEDSLALQLKDGFPKDMQVFYVGSLNVHVAEEEQDEVSRVLLNRFKCIPTFIPADLSEKFYDGFCKRQLWPLFHYMLPYSASHGGRFDHPLWEAYIAVNRLFFDRIIEVLNPLEDFIWIHDYHLMVLPNILRRRFLRIKMGFFLHSPFPSSEIFRTFPVSVDILKSLLSSDIVGFHTFDYARHFLSCCSRMLGLEYQSKRGYLGLEFHGRAIGIKIMPVGVHMGRIQSVMKTLDEDSNLMKDLRQRFEGKLVLFGIDDLDIFKGINLKLLAMERMLKDHPERRGKAVLIQVLNPARGKGTSAEETWNEIQVNYHRINKVFSQPGYQPVVLINTAISVRERVSYFCIADCVVVTAVRDGMNLVPYEYVVCRQGLSDSDHFIGPKKSMLVVSEFVGCSPSLSGAIRVNPWDVQTTSEALNTALLMVDSELGHEKHYNYISTHDVAYWSRSFLQDMVRICADHCKKSYWAIGFSFGFRVMALDPNFRKLLEGVVVPAYTNAKNRAILLDYDGTVMPQDITDKTPSQDVISVLKKLCSDKRNTVFIVSGRGREILTQWLSPCQNIGIAAEHGYYIRWPGKEEWDVCGHCLDFSWKNIAEPVMKQYTEATDGSYIEAKESAMVWKYQEADQTFGSSQAKDMLEHLESVLANEPVAVKRGQFIVEVKPQGVSKGFVAEKIFASMDKDGRQADFLLCIGDDKSDEDMFEKFPNGTLNKKSHFTCTVGQKPSKARFFLDDTTQVISILKTLADSVPSLQPGASGISV